MKKPPDPHYRHRLPAELIGHAVWLYHVFSLSFRDVELILAERGVIVSYESIRRWCLKFGASFANNLRRRRPRPGDVDPSEICAPEFKREFHRFWSARFQRLSATIGQLSAFPGLALDDQRRRQKTVTTRGSLYDIASRPASANLSP
jgi:putative transposase